MEPREELPLTPGARAIVKVSLQGSMYPEGLVVPVKSLVGDKDNGFAIWIFDENNSRVNKQSISVKHIENELAIVEGDIRLGQRVVSAGEPQK